MSSRPPGTRSVRNLCWPDRRSGRPRSTASTCGPGRCRRLGRGSATESTCAMTFVVAGWEAAGVVVTFDAELWIWDARRGDSWTFVSLPVEAVAEIRDVA